VRDTSERTAAGFDEGSLSKRFDMEPFPDHEPPAAPVGFESGVPVAPGPATYIAALPFPGRVGGTRFTTTDEDRGMICESSLNSAEEPGHQFVEDGVEE
jgi:hypothetical protein